MLILVSGGAASGKSAFAEELLVKGGAAPRIYLATMELRDAESRERAQRHRRMRAGKDFITVERPLDLAGLEIPEGCGPGEPLCQRVLWPDWHGGRGGADDVRPLQTGGESCAACGGQQ